MIRAVRTLAILAAGLAFAAQAQAATQMQMQNFGPGTTPNAFNVAFNQFNPALGVLTGVNIKIDATVVGTFDILNFRDSAVNGINLQLDQTFNVTGPGGVNVGLMVSDTVTGESIAARPGGIGTFTQKTINGGGTNGNSNGNAANLAPYIGLGVNNINVNVAASGGVITGSPTLSNLFFGGSSIVNGKITLTYTYTAIPEPSTMLSGLVGLALLGGVAARRRMAKQA
jgi:hypothetical protein